jgi:hypothetical protein
MDIDFKERAYLAAKRAKSSVLVSLEEQRSLDAAVDAVRAADTIEDASGHLEEIQRVFDQVRSRESGRSQAEGMQRQSAEESLAFLEDRLVREIRERKAGQRSHLVILFGLFLFSALATIGGATYLILQSALSVEVIAGSALALSAGTGCMIITARLLQSTREALERLDEKIVAARFMRLAIHSRWQSELGGRVIDPALLMFGKHFAPTSTTLGPDDTVGIVDSLRPM